MDAVHDPLDREPSVPERARREQVGTPTEPASRRDTQRDVQRDVRRDIRYDVPQSARIWNYWMGGKDNFPVDRAAGDAVIAVNPGIVAVATQSRQFLIRSVSLLARDLGVRQFLDIGTGLPTMQNTHEVAQGIAPDARVVYVDNDPVVLAHARALLSNTTPEGVTDYIDADYNDPDLIVADAHNILNFTQPIAVMFMGVLGHIPEFADALAVVRRIVDAVPSGSYLLLWDSTSTSTEVVRGRDVQADRQIPYELRTVEQLARCFEGLELVEPGLVAINAWRPESQEVGGTTADLDAYGGLARKP